MCYNQQTVWERRGLVEGELVANREQCGWQLVVPVRSPHRQVQVLTGK